MAHYGLNPWKFFGFAMYCVPSLPGTLRARFEVAAFVQRRSVWGRLVTPERVAEALLEVLTRAESVDLEVIDPFLNLETSKIGVTRDRYVYPALERAL